jgi:hypothetical protein
MERGVTYRIPPGTFENPALLRRRNLLGPWNLTTA